MRLVRQLRVQLGTDSGHRAASLEAAQVRRRVDANGVRERDATEGIAVPDAQRVRELEAENKDLNQEMRRANEIVGSRGDSFDNSMAESITLSTRPNSSATRDPWRGLDDLELASLEWVDWFNHRRLFHELGRIPPAEFEDLHYRQPHSGHQAETHTNAPA